ncbi:MAG TPA: tyrosine-type recombinase/integrase [Vulgatibacter sp.]|nr:tyrosine-type recombinase/integrase [Vulgatibacter sp.]
MATRKVKARAANGEGCIRQRKSDGRWLCSLTVGWKDGKQVRKVIYGKTRDEVHEKQVALLHTLHTGGVVATSKDSVADFMDRWIEHLEAEGRVQPRTLYGYRQYAKLYIVPGLGKLKLAKLTSKEVQAWVNRRQPAGRTNAGRTAKAGKVSALTMGHALRVLRTALNQAVAWGEIDRNFALSPHVRTPKVEKAEPVYYDATEARTFLDAAVGDRYEAAFTCMLSMGLRPAEAYGLTWWDPNRPERGGVDLEAGVVHLRVALKRDRATKTTVLGPLKTELSRRTLPLTADAVDALRRRRAAQNQEKMRNRKVWHEPIPGLVSTTATGAPLDEAHALRAIHAIAGKAGIKRVHPYALRHTAATLNLSAGVPLLATSRLLGHSRINLTADTYSHATPDVFEDAKAKMDAILGRNA